MSNKEIRILINNHLGIGLYLLTSFMLVSGLTVSQPIKAQEPGFIQEEMQNFKKSDVEFLRSYSYIPSFPLTTIGARNYASFELKGDDVTQASFELEQLYLSAGLPIINGRKRRTRYR